MPGEQTVVVVPPVAEVATVAAPVPPQETVAEVVAAVAQVASLAQELAPGADPQLLARFEALEMRVGSMAEGIAQLSGRIDGLAVSVLALTVEEEETEEEEEAAPTTIVADGGAIIEEIPASAEQPPAPRIARKRYML